MTFSVYIVECADGSLYTGMAKDVNTRITEHNGLSKKAGAKYTRGRRPVKLMYAEEFPARGTALSREYQIKKLSRDQKKRLIQRGT